MKRMGLFSLEVLYFIISLLTVGSFFVGFGIDYFREYRIKASDLESAIEQTWPSAEIVNRWDLDGNKLYVFQTASDYRYIFFPKALLYDRYALNGFSKLHTYWPLDETETLKLELRHFKGTYDAELSIQELNITKVDRLRNITGLPLPVQIGSSIFVLFWWAFGFVRRLKRYGKEGE